LTLKDDIDLDKAPQNVTFAKQVKGQGQGHLGVNVGIN